MRNKFNSTDEAIIERIKIILSDVAVRKILLSFGITTFCAIFVVNFPITFLFSLLFLAVVVMFYAMINMIAGDY
tara:strand:+ start:1090 stop:1311 length:222 start_codon:yes stop_codon:yes gene_type:complete